VAITLDCECGKSYRLRDNMAGKVVRCPACQQALRVGAAPSAARSDAIFDRDRFLLRQKHFSISEKYYVWDDHGEMLLFVERPTHVLRDLKAVLGAVAAAAFVVILVVVVAKIANLSSNATFVVSFLGASLAAVMVAIAMAPRRDVHFYLDDSRSEEVLRVLQDKKGFFITATYTVLDANGHFTAQLRKNRLHNFIRKRWQCLSPEGQVLFLAIEDSIVLSLARRLLGSLYGVLRTNFIIVTPDAQQTLGEFNRNFTILDRYVLDLSRDPHCRLDRRLALALGVMLDTGERR